MSQAIGVPVPFLNKSLEAKDTCLPALGWVQVQVVLLRKFSQWEMLREWRKEEEENKSIKTNFRRLAGQPLISQGTQEHIRISEFVPILKEEGWAFATAHLSLTTGCPE